MAIRMNLVLACLAFVLAAVKAAPSHTYTTTELEELQSKLGHLKSVLDHLSREFQERDSTNSAADGEVKQELDGHEQDIETQSSSEEDSNDVTDEQASNSEDRLFNKLSPEDQAILKKLSHKVQFMKASANKPDVKPEESEKRAAGDTAADAIAALSDEDKLLLLKLHSKIKYIQAMRNADKSTSHESEENEITDDNDLEEALTSLQKNDKSVAHKRFIPQDDESTSLEVSDLEAAKHKIKNLELAVKIYNDRLSGNGNPIREEKEEGLFGPFVDVPTQEREEREFTGSWDEKPVDDGKLGSDDSRDVEEAVSRLLNDISYAKEHNISLEELTAALDQHIGRSK